MIWKPLTGHYEVSDWGFIRSPTTVIAQHDNGRGYPYSQTSTDGVRTPIKIHRAVAQTFIDNPLKLPQVHHLDHDRWNNHYLNLMWIDHKTNTQCGRDHIADFIDPYDNLIQSISDKATADVFELKDYLLKALREGDLENYNGWTVTRTYNGHAVHKRNQTYDNDILKFNSIISPVDIVNMRILQ